MRRVKLSDQRTGLSGNGPVKNTLGTLAHSRHFSSLHSCEYFESARNTDISRQITLSNHFSSDLINNPLLSNNDVDIAVVRLHGNLRHNLALKGKGHFSRGNVKLGDESVIEARAVA